MGNLKRTTAQVEAALDKAESAVQSSALAKVATSGSYNDLSNKPTIPSTVTESTVSGWGFTKNAGTITGVSANGTSVATSGVANIPAASTSVYGVTKLSSSTSSTSTTLAATASAVKAAYDLAQSKGTGTVTAVKLNGTTYSPSSGVIDLGTISGSGGGGSGESYAGNYSIQSFNPSIISGSRLQAQPNTYYVGTYAAGEYGLTVTLAAATNNSIVNEYVVEFSWASSIKPLSLPSTIRWANGDTLVPEYGHTYVLSIVNNIATYLDVNEMLHPEYEGRPD